MKLNCVIVEDEPLALERTKSYVRKIPSLNLLSCFDNGADALLYLRAHPVDLVFLDVHLGEMSGIDLVERGNIGAKVIFTTAYHEYALKGYELNVADYLLKPFTFERFVQAVDKIGKRPDTRGFIFIKTEYRLEKIMFADILYIEGMRDYRRIYTTSKKIMTLQTFRELEEKVPEMILCRVHKSYMVALDKIQSIERDRIRIGDRIIPISETYRKKFRELIAR